MNARTVQKWIRKNRGEYMLVKRTYVSTLARQNARLVEIEAKAGKLIKSIDDEVAFAELRTALAVPVPTATNEGEIPEVDGDLEDGLS